MHEQKQHVAQRFSLSIREDIFIPAGVWYYYDRWILFKCRSTFAFWNSKHSFNMFKRVLPRATTWKVTFGTLSSFSRRSFANHFNIIRYNVAHFSPKNRNIFSSQVAFSVVASSGQAALVLFGVPLSNARAVKNKMKKRKKRGAWAPFFE